jgi:carbon-monoxide dehydrogenase medium subunit
VAARFPLFGAGTGTAFVERARRHGDYALAGAAAAVTVVDGVVRRARVSLVSVTDVPDVLDLTGAFEGQDPGGLDWAAADDLVREHVDPVSDIHATAEYRTALVCELVHRCLAQAAASAVAPTQCRARGGRDERRR